MYSPTPNPKDALGYLLVNRIRQGRKAVKSVTIPPTGMPSQLHSSRIKNYLILLPRKVVNRCHTTDIHSVLYREAILSLSY